MRITEKWSTIMEKKQIVYFIVVVFLIKKDIFTLVSQ